MKEYIEKIKVYFESKKELERKNKALTEKVLFMENELYDIREELQDEIRQQEKELTLKGNEIFELRLKISARPDPKNLMREDMGGITLDTNVKANYLEPLTPEEIKQLNRWGFDLANNRWWKHIMDWCLNTEAVKAITYIPQDERKALFGAGVLDGILTLKELVESRKGAFEGDMKKPDEYDADRAIPD